MTPSLIAFLVLLAALFVGLTVMRVLGARRTVVGLWEMAAGVGLIGLAAWTKLWPLALLGAGLVGWGLWRRRRVKTQGAQPGPSPAALRAAAVLGVPANAPPAAVKAAFRKAMASAHPDAGGAAERTRALLEARDVLLQRNTKP
jgi:hypothetical protein